MLHPALPERVPSSPKTAVTVVPATSEETASVPVLIPSADQVVPVSVIGTATVYESTT